MKRAWLIPLISAAFLFFYPTRTTHADAAPPQPPPGSELAPGESITSVAMIWEDVLITIGDESASVQAIFKFQNQGTAPETFDVRFPLGAHDGYGDILTVEQFAAWVDGTAASIEVYDEMSGGWSYNELVPWAHWPVTFPPAQTVEIGVSYTLRPFYNRDGPWQNYLYILETGAGWEGPIREGTITVRLPYEISDFNTLLEDYYPRPQGYRVEGSELIWEFANLEPTEEDNVQFVVMGPRVVREFEAAKAEVEANPDSIDAHLALTRVISEIVIGRHGDADQSPSGLELGEMAAASYQRALELAPNNVDVHIAYLDFMIAQWFPWAGEPPPADLLPTLDRALSLDPDHPRVIELQEYIYSFDLTPMPTQPVVPVTPVSGEPTDEISGTVTASAPTLPPAGETLATEPPLAPTEAAASSGARPSLCPGAALGALIAAPLIVLARRRRP